MIRSRTVLASLAANFIENVDFADVWTPVDDEWGDAKPRAATHYEIEIATKSALRLLAR